LPPTSCLPARPKYETSWLKIIATIAEAIVIRPHSGTSGLKLINQVGESVAFLRSSEEDVYYRNDSMKYCGAVRMEVEVIGCWAKLTSRHDFQMMEEMQLK
jgi:hypothetical protein